MSYDKNQFRELISEVLKEYNLYSESAVNLLLGTAAQESKFGTFLHQLGRGPAHGAFQVEEATFNDLKKRFSKKFSFLSNITFEELRWNLKHAILVARIKYYSVPKSLPEAKDVLALAKYWKKYYNTDLGDGTVEQFVENYDKYVD